jgi:integrase
LVVIQLIRYPSPSWRCVAALTPYLAERATHPGDALFPGPSGQHLSRDALEHRLAKHLAIARANCPSLKGRHVTMHTLRHTAAMGLLQAGCCPSLILPMTASSVLPMIGV